jgi:hypothetical protein
MSRQLTQQEAKVRYVVRLKDRRATFLWSSMPEKLLRSSVDLRVKIHPPEILPLAENLGCLLEDEKLFAPSLDVYNRLLIYACVRSTVKDIKKARDLATLVLDINDWDALYWASKFRELWWKHSKYRPLLKAIKAFKFFFDLV